MNVGSIQSRPTAFATCGGYSSGARKNGGQLGGGEPSEAATRPRSVVTHTTATAKIREVVMDVVPLPLKIGYTLFLCVLVPTYWIH